MTALTRQQRTALDFILKYTGKNGIAPAYDEIATAVGVTSKASVFRLVAALEERGCIRRLPDRARSIEVVRPVSAEFHLRSVLDQFKTTGTVSDHNHAVIAARQFIQGRAA